MSYLRRNKHKHGENRKHEHTEHEHHSTGGVHFNMNTGFNCITFGENLKACMMDDGENVDLAKFLVAYRDVTKFISMMGRLFTFANIELNDKIGNVERCINNDTENHYVTVKSAIEYEKATGLYKTHSNTSVSLLRLLRGLDFIRKLLEMAYQNFDNDKKCYEIAWTAYQQTLGPRHPWAIRHLVRVGLRLLPRKEIMIDYIMCGLDRKKGENIHAHESFVLETLDNLNKVFERVNKIYAENDFLELVPL